MNKKVSGVMLNTSLKESQSTKVRDDIHEITVNDIPPKEQRTEEQVSTIDSMDHIRIHTTANNRVFDEVFKDIPIVV